MTVQGHPRDGEDEEEPAQVGKDLKKKCLESQIKRVL